METATKTIDQVVAQKTCWKSPEMDNYATALLQAAIALQRSGIEYFNNDDVPENKQPLDKTTVGAVFRWLRVGGVIDYWSGDNKPELKIFAGRRTSSRTCCNSHANPLYKLVSLHLADAWLERHSTDPATDIDRATDAVQKELFA
jgi:hypothetical protein